MSSPHPELPLLELALLWAMRAWVIGQSRNIEIGPRITRMFASLKAPEAGLRLDGFMGELREGATRRLNIACVCRPEVTDDETLVLDAFALLQEAHEDEAAVLLGRLIGGNGVIRASRHALALVGCLNAAGHFLPRGPETLRRHAFCHIISSVSPQPRREIFH